jgi:hypothetical protein
MKTTLKLLICWALYPDARQDISDPIDRLSGTENWTYVEYPKEPRIIGVTH